MQSPFVFLFLENAEKYGFSIPPEKFDLQKKSLLSCWSQIDDILSVTRHYEPDNEDYLERITNVFESMVEMHGSPHFQFIQDQVLLLLTKPNGRRFTKHALILAGELQPIVCYEILVPSIFPMKKELESFFLKHLMIKILRDFSQN